MEYKKNKEILIRRYHIVVPCTILLIEKVKSFRVIFVVAFLIKKKVLIPKYKSMKSIEQQQEEEQQEHQEQQEQQYQLYQK